MAAVVSMPDADTPRFVRTDNYHAPEGAPELVARINALAAG